MTALRYASAEQATPPTPPTPPTAPQVPGTPGAPTTLSPAAGQPRVIEVPDGRGGTTRLVIGEDGSVIVGTPTEATAPPRANDIPRGVLQIIEMGTIAVVVIILGTSILRLVNRWMERRAVPPASSPDVARRLQAIEEAVDSIAIEVERISEGQRFTSKLLAERTHAAAPEFLAAEARDPVERAPR